MRRRAVPLRPGSPRGPAGPAGRVSPLLLARGRGDGWGDLHFLRESWASRRGGSGLSRSPSLASAGDAARHCAAYKVTGAQLTAIIGKRLKLIGREVRILFNTHNHLIRAMDPGSVRGRPPQPPDYNSVAPPLGPPLRPSGPGGPWGVDRTRFRFRKHVAPGGGTPGRPLCQRIVRPFNYRTK